MPYSLIRWGGGTQPNVLRFQYGLRDVVTDREPRDGTEWSRTPGGAEDAWTTGRDYTMQATAQFVPIDESRFTDASPVSGPDSWTEFFRWARGKRTFRFYPDATLSEFYTDGCFLDSPMRGTGANRTPTERDVTFKIRHPTTDFMWMLRGLMLDYAPGAPLADYAGATFTRSTTATYRGRPDDATGPLGASALAGVLRDRHFEGGLNTVLVECQRTQICTQPENFAAWNNRAGTPTLTSGQADPFGGTAAYLLTDDDITVSEGKTLACGFTGDGVKSGSIFMKAGSATVTTFHIVDDTAGQQRFFVDVTWSAAGVPSTNVQAGTLLWVVYVGFGWYWFGVQTTAVTAANNNQVVFRIEAPTPANTGTGLFFGVNLFNAVYPSSYQGPSLTTRNADALVFQHAYKPQPMFFYFKFVERGNTQGNGTIRLFRLGSGTSGTVRTFYITFNSIYGTRLNVDGNVTSATVNTVPAIGDVVELLVLLNSDGSAQLSISVNGGAVQTNGASVANPFPPGFNWDQQVFALGDLGDPLTAFAKFKYGPLVHQGVSRNTMPLARAA